MNCKLSLCIYILCAILCLKIVTAIPVSNATVKEAPIYMLDNNCEKVERVAVGDIEYSRQQYLGYDSYDECRKVQVENNKNGIYYEYDSFFPPNTRDENPPAKKRNCDICEELH